MRIGRNEIIEELTEHIRQSGGEPGEWRVGTAEGQWLGEMDRFKIQNSRETPASIGEMDRFKIQNSRETPASMAGLAYREAHTTYAADDAVDYLVNAFGLKLAPEAERRSASSTECGAKQRSARAERGSALQNPAPGRIVFVYHQTPPAPAAPCNAQATLDKVAA